MRAISLSVHVDGRLAGRVVAWAELMVLMGWGRRASRNYIAHLVKCKLSIELKCIFCKTPKGKRSVTDYEQKDLS